MSEQNSEVMSECQSRMRAAELRYGGFASSHEALGVLTEEWDELRDAIRSNSLESIRGEAIDLAAVALRLADACRSDPEFAERSKK
jgi:NTP pyrophosphatase (non-canonical NTP hydrolase)